MYYGLQPEIKLSHLIMFCCNNFYKVNYQEKNHVHVYINIKCQALRTVLPSILVFFEKDRYLS